MGGAVSPPPPPTATHRLPLRPGGNLVGWGGTTPVGIAPASIAGQFDALFTFDNATQSFRSFQPAAPSFLNTLDDLALVWTQPVGWFAVYPWASQDGSTSPLSVAEMMPRVR